VKDLLRLVHYVKPYWHRVAAAIVSAFLISVCFLLLLALMGSILDEVVPQNDFFPQVAGGRTHLLDKARGLLSAGAAHSEILKRWSDALHAGTRGTMVLVAALIVVIFLFKGIFTYLTQYLTRWTGLQAVRDLRVDLYARIQRQSLQFFSDNSTGHLISRIMGDVSRMQRTVSGDLADVFRLGAIVIGQAAWLFFLNPKLAAFCLVLLPIVVAPVAWIGRRLKDASRGSMQKMGDVALIMKEGIAGARIVQAFGMESFEIDRFSKALNRMQRAEKRGARLMSLSGPIMELLGAIGGAVLLAWAASRIAAGKLTVSEFGTFVTALFIVFSSIRNLVKINNDLQQSMAAARRVFEMMDLPVQVTDAPGAPDLPGFERDIVFRHVAFAYGRSPVLEDVDLAVRRGEMVAIVGSSGAGKSTLVNLLPRFYDVTGGALLIDGRDVREVSLLSLRRLIGIVTQEVILFDDTVRNNIAYGRFDIPFEKVVEAAKAAHAHGFIEALPQGYDTPLGESGHRLSQGQRQRLSIARALLKNPPILILDEATSSLDSESEAEVQAALENLMLHRTVFVIAHRLSTVRRADAILVLDQGRIVERGTHADLLARSGVYARLHHLQFRDETPGPRVSVL
jgi:subfamily B ATP-binding cassette protein MsbA